MCIFILYITQLVDAFLPMDKGGVERYDFVTKVDRELHIHNIKLCTSPGSFSSLIMAIGSPLQRRDNIYPFYDVETKILLPRNSGVMQ